MSVCVSDIPCLCVCNIPLCVYGRDGIGKEVISRFSTDISNNGIFYTDANGREVLKRVCVLSHPLTESLYSSATVSPIHTEIQ